MTSTTCARSRRQPASALPRCARIGGERSGAGTRARCRHNPRLVTVPEISVVVPSHDRPLRLRWLLNALEEQTLDRSRWEVVVAHDSAGPETEELLRTHPLAAAGVLRHLTFAPGPGPAAKRNAAWRLARAGTIVFT